MGSLSSGGDDDDAYGDGGDGGDGGNGGDGSDDVNGDVSG